MSTRQTTSGFSLVEMLVVLAIISLIAVVGLSGFSARRNTETVNTLSQKIRQMAAVTSLRAISSGETSSLVIDIESQQISSENSPAVIVVPPAFTLSVFTGAELIQQNGKAVINFFGDGSSTGGEVSIQDHSGTKRTVRILWLTGAIEVKDGNSS